jgi:hypothetical protein
MVGVRVGLMTLAVKPRAEFCRLTVPILFLLRNTDDGKRGCLVSPMLLPVSAIHLRQLRSAMWGYSPQYHLKHEAATSQSVRERSTASGRHYNRLPAGIHLVWVSLRAMKRRGIG